MSSELRILDVGHGNSALLLAEHVCVVDSPANTILVDTLASNGITHVDVVMVSHADADHVAGITTLLLSENISCGQLFVNPNSQRGTDAWKAFRVAVQDAKKRGLTLCPTLTSECPSPIIWGDTRIEVLSPGGEDVLAGPGGQSLIGGKITTNSASAVIRICQADVPKVLLAGDMTAATMADIQRRGCDMRAEVLVYPHHGGATGCSDDAGFAASLIAIVEPELVVFSLGRGRYGTPRPEVVRAIRNTKPDIRIACTQLSENCAASLAELTFEHLNADPAYGRKKQACCIGSLTLPLHESIRSSHTLGAHRAWVEAEIEGALCRMTESKIIQLEDEPNHLADLMFAPLSRRDPE